MPHGSEAGRFGGQALIEGVLIRGQNAMAMAIRRPDGSIHIESSPIASSTRTALRETPFLRGILVLYETFALGIKALYTSARISAGDAQGRMTKADAALAVTVIVTAAALFFAGPVLMTSWMGHTAAGEWAEVVGEGFLRIGMVLSYILLIGRLSEVRRVFGYHGAEHRAVHAYEHGAPLTPESVRQFSNEHPRCGTAFLLTVGAISFVAFLMLGTPSLPERIIERLVLTPIIAAVAYEVIRASQTYERFGVVQVLKRPGIWLQRLTTGDPDEAQIEVAIAALVAAVEAESNLAAASAGQLAVVPVLSAGGPGSDI